MSRPKEQPNPQSTRREIDWAICLIRWALIAAIPLITLLDPAPHLSASNLTLVMAVASTYSAILTLLLALSFLPWYAPLFAAAADTLGIIVLLHLSGGGNSPYFFYPLFPILVTGLRLGWERGLFSAVLFVIAQALWVALDWRAAAGLAQIFPFLLSAFFYLLLATMGGVISQHAAVQGLWSRTPPPPDEEESLVPDRLRMVYEMAATLSATLNYHQVLGAILDISRLGFEEFNQRGGRSVGMVLLYDDDGWLSVASHRNLAVEEDETRRIPGREGIVQQAIDTATAVIGGEPAQDPELSQFESLTPYKSMICVPLRAGFETYGAVLFATVDQDAYTGEHKDLLAVFCNQATIALQNASLYQSLREERDKIVDREEEARHRLARELHDGPTQDVAAIAMRLNFARLLVERDPARARAELARLEDLAHRTVREIRSMLFTLRPVILETEGLVAALNQYADNLRKDDGLAIDVEAEDYEDCLDLEAQGVVFAIIEEAVSNARKHAEASHIWIRLAVRDDLFVAQIEDDGRGFDVAAVEQSYASRGSLGMINLRERAALVEGNINIESTPGQGTRVTLLVPIDREAI